MTRIVGHRGAAALAPENTIKGIETAIDHGVDCVEMDVRKTRDDRLVLLHDPLVNRTTDGTGRLRTMAFDAVQQLDAGDGEAVPSLAEALAYLEDTAVDIQIELKEGGTAAPAVDLVESYDLRDRTMFISFKQKALKPLKGFDVETGYLTRLTSRMSLLQAKRLGCDHLLSYHRGIDSRMISMVGDRGFGLGFWTVDERERIGQLIDHEPHFLTTNRPDLAVSLCEEQDL